MKVLSIFGTRPEAIKMAPVVAELAKRTAIESRVCVTAQHRGLLDQVLSLFRITPDYDLNLMTQNQTLSALTSRIIEGLDPVILKEKPDWILVQGDTTTVMAASLVAFYNKIKVGHVEAGLRTHDNYHPFPEEVNRRISSVIAALHFAPTMDAKRNLLAEGIAEAAIRVTGNTVIDALKYTASLSATGVDSPVNAVPADKRVILVTAHRRENFGQPIHDICQSLVQLVRRYDDVWVTFPVHPNPNIRGVVESLLASEPRIQILPPLEYVQLVHVLKRSYLVLTDSGGIQEEAPGLGKPVLVLRETTERPEAVSAGTARLVGTKRDTIVAHVRELIENRAAYEAMARATNPYGDGHSAARIVNALT